MKFKHPHKLNGHQYDTGDPYTGDVNLGRFLHQRGVIEVDGGPDDEAITAKYRRPTWATEQPPTPPAEAPTPARRRAPARKKE